MIDYEMYEDDEVLKPRHVVKKPKTKKSKHKHNYTTEIKSSSFSTSYMLMIEICTICGKEGDSKIIKDVN